MFVLIVGCGRVGSALAREMVNDGHDVSIIDQSPEGFARLGEEFPGTFTEGPALELTVLKAAGIERDDAFVAATDGDNTNLVISQVARERFNIPCVVVRVLDPYRAKFYGERGLTTVCPTQIAIEQMSDALRACGAALQEA